MAKLFAEAAEVGMGEALWGGLQGRPLFCRETDGTGSETCVRFFGATCFMYVLCPGGRLPHVLRRVNADSVTDGGGPGNSTDG